jgi:hypothetical protein
MRILLRRFIGFDCLVIDMHIPLGVRNDNTLGIESQFYLFQ